MMAHSYTVRHFILCVLLFMIWTEDSFMHFEFELHGYSCLDTCLYTLVNVYVDLVVFTSIVGTS